MCVVRTCYSGVFTEYYINILRLVRCVFSGALYNTQVLYRESVSCMEYRLTSPNSTMLIPFFEVDHVKTVVNKTLLEQLITLNISAAFDKTGKQKFVTSMSPLI